MEINLLLVVGLLFCLLIVLIMSGVYIAVAMLLLGITTLWLFTPKVMPGIGAHLFGSVNSFILVAIPLFIFMGHVILQSGLSEKLYRGVAKITSVLPGGLIHTNVVGCAIFAAISGSAAATSITIGTVAIPEQIERGYDRKLITGSILCAGSLGPLIPPSIIMILYGAFVKVSVARLFMGGVFPGIILAGMFMCWVAIAAIIWPSWAPEREKFTRAYFTRVPSAFKELWPFLILMTIILGSIYTGQATPTEAAAVSAVMALIFAAIFRQLNFTLIKKAAVETIRTCGFVNICFVGGRLMGVAISMIKLPAQVMTLIAALALSPMEVWLVMIIVYLFLGCLMEDLSLLIASLPVAFPLMMMLGFDPIWFGVMLVILINIAMITPPVGLNLYMVQKISLNTPIRDVMIGALPFVVIMLAALALFTAFPQLVLWLPNTMFEM